MALEYMEIELYSINITSISFNFKVIGYTLFWIFSILFQFSQNMQSIERTKYAIDLS